MALPSASRMVLNTALQQGTASGWTADVAQPLALRALRRRPAKRLQQSAWRRSPQKRCRHQQCRAAVVTEQSEVCRCAFVGKLDRIVLQLSKQNFDKGVCEQADKGCRSCFCWAIRITCCRGSSFGL